MRATRSRPRLARLLAVIAAMLLVAACTNEAPDVRSPAPTGSLSPASSVDASAAP